MRPVDHPQFTTLAALLALSFPAIQTLEYRVVDDLLYAVDNTNWYTLGSDERTLTAKAIDKCPTRYAA